MQVITTRLETISERRTASTGRPWARAIAATIVSLFHTAQHATPATRASAVAPGRSQLGTATDRLTAAASARPTAYEPTLSTHFTSGWRVAR